VVSGLGRELKIWAPSHSRTPPKKIFPQNVGDGGGGGGGGGGGEVDVLFPKTKRPKNFSKAIFM
jgi:hypothetical protein